MKIGLVIKIQEEAILKRAPTYAEIRAKALKAEQVGFDSIWLYDHLFYHRKRKPNIGIWECWTMLSALAEATHRLELGTLVLCNAFRNPAILAKMAATLDEVSQGRFILGIGAGWNKPEFDAFGLPFDHRVSRFEEALQIIQPLLRMGRVDFAGSYYQSRNCEITPRGPTSTGPRLLVGAGKPRMLSLTARYADMVNVGYLGLPETLKPRLARIRKACKEVSRDPETLDVTVLVALWYPDLSDKPTFLGKPLTGSVVEIAEALHGYQELGVKHIMFHLVPDIAEAMERLDQAVKLFRT